MATSRAAASHEEYTGNVYVFEVPVRVWHWAHALAITTLAITGYLIANPLPSISGEASDSFLMGNIRLIHFSAAMVFAVGLFVRFYWAIVGNHFARHLFIVPVWSGNFWSRLWHEVKMYNFLTRKVAKYRGHNPLAQLAMFFMFLLPLLFAIATGFALYAEGAGMESAWYWWFGWVFAVLGDSMTVHTLHRINMWIIVCFSLIHIYVAVREDIMSRQSLVSTMISGWRYFKDDKE